MRGWRLFASCLEPSRRRFTVTVLCALACCALLASISAGAQSGRRKPPPLSPAPTATPTPDASSSSSSSGGYSDSDARPKPQTATGAEAVVTFIVFSDETSTRFLNIPMSTPNIIIDSFVKRLGDSPGVSVSSGGASDRRRAREHAKVERGAYTILLQVDEDRTGAQVGSRSASDLANLMVRYYVYEPSSATLKHEGQVYMRPYQPSRRVGGVNLPIPVPSSRRVPVEYIFEQAGRDAADRVLSAFHLRARD